MTDRIRHNQLIAQIYAVAANPAKLLGLREILARLADNDLLNADAEQIAYHFEQAEKLLSDEMARTGVIMPERNIVALRLDKRLMLIWSDVELADAKAGMPLPDWIWLPDRKNRDRSLLKEVADGKRSHAMIQLLSSPSSQRPVQHIARISEDDSDIIELIEVPIRWDADVARNFASDFSLTAAEQAILREIIERSNLRLLAEERKTALGTVRNQLKRMLNKLELRSQGELIALYGGYQEIMATTTANRPSVNQSAEASRVYSIDNVDIRVDFHGPSDGVPLLYLHPLFGGPLLTENLLRAVEQHGRRLIAPWRPYCGRIEDEGSGENLVKDFADRLAQLLDILKIETVDLLAAAGGNCFAFALASRHPEKCRQLLIAGPSVPFSTAQEMKMLGLGHRLPLQLARFLPAAMRMYVRAVLAKLHKGLEASYLDNFFKDSPADLAFVDDPQNRDFLKKSILVLFEHGYQCGIEELIFHACDWSSLVSDIDIPVTLLHGNQDRLAPDALIRSFADRHGFEKKTAIRGAGSFLLYQEPDLVLSYLD